MCIFANEGGPKSKSSRKETPLKIQKYKEKHVSGKNLEKMFSAPTPNVQYHLKIDSFKSCQTSWQFVRQQKGICFWKIWWMILPKLIPDFMEG